MSSLDTTHGASLFARRTRCPRWTLCTVQEVVLNKVSSLDTTRTTVVVVRSSNRMSSLDATHSAGGCVEQGVLVGHYAHYSRRCLLVEQDVLVGHYAQCRRLC